MHRPIIATQGGKPEFQSGAVASHPHLPTAGEVFGLRKLMPMTGDYDFNIHVMDFKPGEHLNVKVRRHSSSSMLVMRLDAGWLAPVAAHFGSPSDAFPLPLRSMMGPQEVHYNQHGLLLLQGKGIYRLADKWCAALLSSPSASHRGHPFFHPPLLIIVNAVDAFIINSSSSSPP